MLKSIFLESTNVPNFSYVGPEAYLFQAPQSIDAAIILWILLFSANDRGSLERNHFFFTFKLQPQPG